MPEPLTKNHTVNCLTSEENRIELYNDNLGLLIALALHLHGNGGLAEETSEISHSPKRILEELSKQVFKVLV